MGVQRVPGQGESEPDDRATTPAVESVPCPCARLPLSLPQLSSPSLASSDATLYSKYSYNADVSKARYGIIERLLQCLRRTSLHSGWNNCNHCHRPDARSHQEMWSIPPTAMLPCSQNSSCSVISLLSAAGMPLRLQVGVMGSQPDIRP